MSNDIDETIPTPGPGFPKWMKWGLLGALAVLIVGYGAIFLYAKVLNDSPDELGTSDLDAKLAGDGTTATDGGTWTVTDASELGYRVNEVLFGVNADAVGRTNQITGALTIDGTTVTDAEFVVDVASITSDEGRRDGQFRGRIMSTDEFPTATFTLTAPIELGVEATEGAAVTATATGNLTLRGVTNPVEFEVTAKLDNGKIGVLGNIPVVFADYEIANPSFGGVTTEDNGLLEFVLVFAPA
jgi:polyisoprenoid-binding protein YceI